jgi:hypothetical protein
VLSIKRWFLFLRSRAEDVEKGPRKNKVTAEYDLWSAPHKEKVKNQI